MESSTSGIEKKEVVVCGIYVAFSEQKTKTLSLTLRTSDLSPKNHLEKIATSFVKSFYSNTYKKLKFQTLDKIASKCQNGKKLPF